MNQSQVFSNLHSLGSCAVNDVEHVEPDMKTEKLGVGYFEDLITFWLVLRGKMVT